MPPSSQMAIQLTLLILISCSLYSMYPSSSSSFSESSSLALLVLVISTCLSLLFTNLRKLLRDNNTHKANKAAPASMEEAVTVFQEKSIVPQDEALEDLMGGSLSDSSECTTNDDEEGTEEGSVSDEADDDDDDDDESLIEISLVDGHYVGGAEQAEQRRAYNYKKDLLAEFLPDLLLDRRDFFDILSEISEEDSLIEIDIARGSIKCSANLDIKA